MQLDLFGCFLLNMLATENFTNLLTNCFHLSENPSWPYFVPIT